MDLIMKRLTNLMTVKSIITLVMLAVFAWLTVTSGAISPEFMELFKMIVIFYFGTQVGKAESK